MADFDAFLRSGTRWWGKKKAFAIKVGTTALAMTVATNTEYCPLVMIWWDSPNRAEMVPKVRPVDINRVVYPGSVRF